MEQGFTNVTIECGFQRLESKDDPFYCPDNYVTLLTFMLNVNVDGLNHCTSLRQMFIKNSDDITSEDLKNLALGNEITILFGRDTPASMVQISSDGRLVRFLEGVNPLIICDFEMCRKAFGAIYLQSLATKTEIRRLIQSDMRNLDMFEKEMADRIIPIPPYMPFSDDSE